MGRRHLADPALATHDPLTHEPAARAPDRNRYATSPAVPPGYADFAPGGAKHVPPPAGAPRVDLPVPERRAPGRRPPRGRVPGGDRAQARALGQGDGVRDLRRLGDAGWVAERGSGGAAAVARDHRVVAAVRGASARPRAARRATAPPPLGRLRGHQAPRRGLSGRVRAGVGGRREPRGGRADVARPFPPPRSVVRIGADGPSVATLVSANTEHYARDTALETLEDATRVSGAGVCATRVTGFHPITGAAAPASRAAGYERHGALSSVPSSDSRCAVRAENGDPLLRMRPARPPGSDPAAYDIVTGAARAAAPSAFERPGAARRNPGLAAMGAGSRRGFVELENGDPAARAGTLGARRVDTTPW